MARRLSLLVVVPAAVLMATAPTPAAASRFAQFGIQDDAWLMYGPGTLDERLTMLDGLGVKIARFTIRWDEVAPTAPGKERDPADPAYRWGSSANVLEGLRDHHIRAVVTIWGSPRWANGNRAPNRLPDRGFGNFAYAASKRFPWVHLWTVWNEPNTLLFSTPVSPKLYTRRLLNPAYALLHLASKRNRVAGGVTSPRRTSSGVSPLAFMRGMRLYHARLDAYAQNPYPGKTNESPFHDPCSWCSTFTMARLPEIRAQVTRLFGAKPIWLTEYGYQTNPPDRILGVSPALQAAYVGEAALRVWQQAGVTMLIHFLVRDDIAPGGWQSGFITTHGSAKPSYRAFGLPLAQVSRRGLRTVVWGQVRSGSGHRRYVLQRWTGHRWTSIGSARRTDANGTFVRAISARRGERIRLWTPVVHYVSPTLRIA